jgi:peptidoglycan/xylan/chitin deacetylase (PgdA/CDA1 family)
MIEANNTDQAIDLVKNQIREFYCKGYELGLHLHPQWYNARYESGRWRLDYDCYNLCTLPRDRIKKNVDRSIEYLRKLLGLVDFNPFSFRAGNWLFQPTRTVAKELVDHGVKVDSSVFKGGLQHQHKMDYRRALKNGYYWSFADEVNVPDPKGNLVEFPIYTKMVPLWKLPTTKRIGLQRKVPTRNRAGKKRLFRILDFLRPYHPLKFDFCRMTMRELMHMLGKEIQRDQKDPKAFRPIVAIGHTKDLIDIETVESLLCYLRRKGIGISTFKDVYRKVKILGEKTNSRGVA